MTKKFQWDAYGDPKQKKLIKEERKDDREKLARSNHGIQSR